MAKSLLNQLAHNRSFNKQTKNLGNTAPKTKKVHYNKTVQVTKPTYKRLKLYSFKNDITMGKVVTKAVNNYLDHHKV